MIDTHRKLVFTKTLLYFENRFQKCYPIGMIQRHWKRSDKKKIFLDLNSILVGEYFIYLIDLNAAVLQFCQIIRWNVNIQSKIGLVLVKCKL